MTKKTPAPMSDQERIDDILQLGASEAEEYEISWKIQKHFDEIREEQNEKWEEMLLNNNVSHNCYEEGELGECGSYDNAYEMGWELSNKELLALAKQNNLLK